MARLTGDFLSGIGPRVFGTKETTFNDVGRAIPISDFRETIEAIRADMRATLTSLPETAFSEQQAGEGEDVWAAGQVVAHVSNSFHSMTSTVRPLLDMSEGDTPERYDMEEHPGRAMALAILDALDTATTEFFNALPDDGDYARSVSHARFGEMDSKGWLTLVALHENNHLDQIRRLNGA